MLTVITFVDLDNKLYKMHGTYIKKICCGSRNQKSRTSTGNTNNKHAAQRIFWV